MLKEPVFLFWLLGVGLLLGAVIYRVIRFGGIAAAFEKVAREREVGTVVGEPTALVESKLVLRKVRHPRSAGPCVEVQIVARGVGARRSLSVVLTRGAVAKLREALDDAEH